MRNAGLAEQFKKEGGNLIVLNTLVGNDAFFVAIESSGVILVIYKQFIRVFRRKHLFRFAFVKRFLFHAYILPMPLRLLRSKFL